MAFEVGLELFIVKKSCMEKSVLQWNVVKVHEPTLLTVDAEEGPVEVRSLHFRTDCVTDRRKCRFRSKCERVTVDEEG